MTPVEHDRAFEPDEVTSQLELRRLRRGQAAVARERAAEQRDAAAADRDQSQAEADQRTWNRGEAADDREHAAADRDDDAAGRDNAPARTDQRRFTPEHGPEGRERVRLEGERTSDRRHAAEDRRRAASDREQAASDRRQSHADAHKRTANRGESVKDRERAAADRRATVADRLAADRDHRQTRAELRRAQLDELTGAFGRQMGMLILEREIDRARRGNGGFMLAYIDVNGLKQVNDREGHLAGDRLLSDIAHAIQKHLRSYDTLVRVGGDEFVCALVDCTPTIARSRFQDMRATIRQTQAEASISVGFAELHPEENLMKLMIRADLALYEEKRSVR